MLRSYMSRLPTLSAQRELHESKTNEARMLREKEVSDMRVSTLEHELRAVQGEALKYKAVAMDCDARVKVQHETITALKAQVRLGPEAQGQGRGTTSCHPCGTVSVVAWFVGAFALLLSRCQVCRHQN